MLPACGCLGAIPSVEGGLWCLVLSVVRAALCFWFWVWGLFYCWFAFSCRCFVGAGGCGVFRGVACRLIAFLAAACGWCLLFGCLGGFGLRFAVVLDLLFAILRVVPASFVVFGGLVVVLWCLLFW